MKTFIALFALAAVALAAPEADPQFLYNTYGYGVPAVTTYNTVPTLAYSTKVVSPLYNALYSPYVTRVFKREAEAEPKAEAEAKADPALIYSNYFGAYPYAHAAYSVAPYVSAYAAPYAYTAYNPYVARVFKREAEAEPEAKADPYYLGGVAPYAAYSTYATYAPATYAYSAALPYAYKPYGYGYSYYHY